MHGVEGRRRRIPVYGRITGFNKLYIYLESGAWSGGEEEKDTHVWEDNWV